jgi:hypothetical protein
VSPFDRNSKSCTFILTEKINSVTEIGGGSRCTRNFFNGQIMLNLTAGYELELWPKNISVFSMITSTPRFKATMPSFGGPADVVLYRFVLGAGLSI